MNATYRVRDLDFQVTIGTFLHQSWTLSLHIPHSRWLTWTTLSCPTPPIKFKALKQMLNVWLICWVQWQIRCLHQSQLTREFLYPQFHLFPEIESITEEDLKSKMENLERQIKEMKRSSHWGYSPFRYIFIPRFRISSQVSKVRFSKIQFEWLSTGSPLLVWNNNVPIFQKRENPHTNLPK